MIKILLSIVMLVFIESAAIGSEKGTLEDFHAVVLETFAFSPQKLNKEELKAKSSILDSFWKKVTADPEKLLPKLREELQRDGTPPFFYYDGSKLLLSLSKAKSDHQLAAMSISKCDLRDVEPSDYLRTVNMLGSENLDTSAAAFRVLDYPDFKVYVPLHSLSLNQGISLVFMIFPLSEEWILEKVVKRLDLEKNDTARKSLYLALWYSVTVKGDELIATAAKSEKESKGVKEFAESLQRESVGSLDIPEPKLEEIKNQYILGKILLKMSPGILGKSGNLSKEELESLKALLQSLWETNTIMGKDFVKTIAENKDGSVPPEISATAKGVMKKQEEGGAAPESKRQFFPETIADLRKERRLSLVSLSDEALQDFQLLTLFIRLKYSGK